MNWAPLGVPSGGRSECCNTALQDSAGGGLEGLCGGQAMSDSPPTFDAEPPETLGRRNFRPENRCRRRSCLL